MKEGRLVISILLLVLSLVLMPTEGLGVPPEDYFNKQKEAAFCHVDINIQKIIQTKVGKYIEIEIEARITKIHRSKSKLSVGDMINIQYHCPPTKEGSPPIAPGEGFPCLVKIDEDYSAFLNKTDRIRGFKPAAASKSFEHLSTEQKRTQGTQ